MNLTTTQPRSFKIGNSPLLKNLVFWVPFVNSGGGVVAADVIGGRYGSWDGAGGTAGTYYRTVPRGPVTRAIFNNGDPASLARILNFDVSFEQLFSGTWTVALWVLPTNANAPSWGWGCSTNSNKDQPLSLYDSGWNVGDGTSFQLLTHPGNTAAGASGHYALVDNGTNYVSYRDGVQTSSTAITVNPATSAATINKLYITASGFTGTTLWDTIVGWTLDFRIYNRGLSATEIRSLVSMRQGTGRPQSAHAYGLQFSSGLEWVMFKGPQTARQPRSGVGMPDGLFMV